MKFQKNISAFAKRLIVLISLLAPFFSTEAKAQWKLIMNDSLSPSHGYFTIYFLKLPGPPKIGFISTNNLTYKTTDGGFTWHSVSGIDAAVWNFTFKDSLTGWSGTQPVCETTDAGETWFPTSNLVLGEGPFDIYYDSTSDGLFLAALSGTDLNFELVSWDEGATWENQRSYGHLGFAFANGDTGIQSGAFYDEETQPYGTPMLQTTDGGHTWNSLTIDSQCWQPLAVPGTSTYFMFTPLGTFMRSDDAGLNWRTIYSFPYQNPPATPENPYPDPYLNANNWFTGSCIAGDEHDLYVNTVNGCYHSTDTGNTWDYLCGLPSQGIEQQRFYAKGHTVFLQTINYPTNSIGNWQNYVWRLNLDSMQYFPTGIAFNDGSKLTTVPVGNSVTVNYALTGNDSIGIQTGHLVFHFDSNALGLENIKLPPSWTILDSSVKNGIVDLTISGDSNAQLTNPVIQMTFGTYLSSDSAKVYLDSANLSGHRLNCGCEALSMGGSDSVQINFNSSCQDSIILAEMEGKLPFVVQSIVPNPAQNSIQVTLQSSKPVTYDIFDVLGNARLSGVVTQPIDVSSLVSGVYYIKFSSGDFITTRSFTIQKN